MEATTPTSWREAILTTSDAYDLTHGEAHGVLSDFSSLKLFYGDAEIDASSRLQAITPLDVFITKDALHEGKFGLIHGIIPVSDEPNIVVFHTGFGKNAQVHRTTVESLFGMRYGIHIPHGYNISKVNSIGDMKNLVLEERETFSNVMRVPPFALTTVIDCKSKNAADLLLRMNREATSPNGVSADRKASKARLDSVTPSSKRSNASSSKGSSSRVSSSSRKSRASKSGSGDRASSSEGSSQHVSVSRSLLGSEVFLAEESISHDTIPNQTSYISTAGLGSGNASSSKGSSSRASSSSRKSRASKSGSGDRASSSVGSISNNFFSSRRRRKESPNQTSTITKSSDSFKVTSVGSDCFSSKSDSTYGLLLSAIQATSEANKQGEKILNQIKKENVLQLSCEERDHNLGSNGSCPKVNVSSDDLYKPLSENRRKSPMDSAVIKV